MKQQPTTAVEVFRHCVAVSLASARLCGGREAALQQLLYCKKLARMSEAANAAWTPEQLMCR